MKGGVVKGGVSNMIETYNEFLSYQLGIQNLVQSLESMRFQYADLDQLITDNWMEYQDGVLNAVLEETSVDDLSRIAPNIPIDSMKLLGLRTVYDCRGKSEGFYQRMDGIGEVRAQNIVSVVDSFIENARTSLSRRIYKSEASERLLESVYIKIHVDHRRKDMDIFLEKRDVYVARLKAGLQALDVITGISSWNHHKEKMRRPLAYLYRLSQSKEVYYNQFEKLNHIKVLESHYAHFEKYSSMYYAILESILGFDVRDERVMSPVIKELTEKVEGVQLNLEDLYVTPRMYQYFGAQFIIEQVRTLIGDEMGLGKTIEGLIAMNHLHKAHNMTQFIVVAPLSILMNWSREIEEWSDLDVVTYHGDERDESFTQWLNHGGVLLTNYGQTEHLVRDVNRQQSKRLIDMLIVDEAHYVKNPDAKRSQNVYTLGDQSRFITYMTGTPLENRVDEMVNLIGQLQPQIAKRLGTTGFDPVLNPDVFRDAVAPVYLRRNRDDVLDELPDLNESRIWTSLGEAQQKVYEDGILDSDIMLMRRAAWYTVEGDVSNKLLRLLEICNQAELNGNKVIVFSYFRSVLKIVDRVLGDKSVGIISGSVAPDERQRMVDRLDEAEPGSVLVSQIEAGGVGLNIQSANIVILCEPQYKPSIENQAISRAYRMGQTKDVMVFRLLTQNSIDERMMELLYTKSQIFDNYARDSETANDVKNTFVKSGLSMTEYILQEEAKRHKVQRKKQKKRN